MVSSRLNRSSCILPYGPGFQTPTAKLPVCQVHTPLAFPEAQASFCLPSVIAQLTGMA